MDSNLRIPCCCLFMLHRDRPHPDHARLFSQEATRAQDQVLQGRLVCLLLRRALHHSRPRSISAHVLAGNRAERQGQVVLRLVVWCCDWRGYISTR
jgi:hypothetical protein